MNPAPYLSAIAAAYALPAANVHVIDTILGLDMGDRMVPYGAVCLDDTGCLTIGFAGTRTLEEWILDCEIEPDDTPYGEVAAGIWGTYESLRTSSGKSLNEYDWAIVGGHSRGGPLAALWAVEYGSKEYCLFACPKMISDRAINVLKTLKGTAFQMANDVVPHLPLLGYPDLPSVTHILPPKPGGVVYCHELSTYAASLTKGTP